VISNKEDFIDFENGKDYYVEPVTPTPTWKRMNVL